MKSFTLKYGRKSIEFSLPKDNILDVLEKKKESNNYTEEEVISRALDNPIGAPMLEEVIKPKEKICIVVSDITRAWQRMHVFLPYIIKRLEKIGVRDENITFLCATGSHRKQTEEEHKLLLGDLFNRFKIIDHDSRDEDNLCQVGTTSYGTPVKINRLALESDHIIITGAIVYHDLAGWSGGKKSILPGIAGYDSIMSNHSLSLNPIIGSGIHPNVRCGNILNNPIHEDMLEAVEMVKPSFMFNVILGGDGKICDAVAGHYLKAHEEGRKKVSKLNGFTIKNKGDVVIASSGGYPKDIDFYQSTKTLINAKEAVVKGGTIILLSHCEEGIGHRDMEKIILDFDSTVDREKEVRKNYTVSKFIGYLTGIIAKDYRVIMISSLSKTLLSKINIIGVDSMDEAIGLVYKNKKNRRTYIIPQASDILPIYIES